MKIKLIIILLLAVLCFVSPLNSRYVSAEGTQITVAGTIRNTGAGWFVISDSVHVPLNITKIETKEDRIVVWHSVGAKNIHTFIVTPDETMTKEGYAVGVSGGTYYSNVYVYDKNHNLINPNDYKNAGGNIWIYALLSL